jgi:hypothetical protein
MIMVTNAVVESIKIVATAANGTSDLRTSPWIFLNTDSIEATTIDAFTHMLKKSVAGNPDREKNEVVTASRAIKGAIKARPISTTRNM